MTTTAEPGKPIVAICYDFDKTLTPDNMQAQGFIQKIGYDEQTFWEESNALAEKAEMDQDLAWMYEMLIHAEGKELFTRDTLRAYGKQITFFPGVETWFDRIRDYGEQQGVVVEHYIVSSGLKEMIEGTRIADKFTRIFASSFLYNERGVAVWPAQAVNYTNKTQFLFRIEKGCLGVNDQKVNDHFEPDELRVPFRNMIYIGDSATDIPCMRLVNSLGGYAIGVYDADAGSRMKVYRMMQDDRIGYFRPADYSANGGLETLVKDIIGRTAINERIEQVRYACMDEVRRNRDGIDTKNDLILKLEASASFRQTRRIFDEMRKLDAGTWTAAEVRMIASIVLSNSQVSFAANDSGIRRFLLALFSRYPDTDEVGKATAFLSRTA